MLSGDTTVYVYDAFGQLAAEYSNAQNTAPCTTCYLSGDRLVQAQIALAILSGLADELRTRGYQVNSPGLAKKGNRELQL
jgi:hypothetical protein